MKDFKFFKDSKKMFRFEALTQINYYPECLIMYETWTREKSDLIKEWISDFYFSGTSGDYLSLKYFPEFDRTCQITEYGLITSDFEHKFTVTVIVYRSQHEYSKVYLEYPINHIIYSPTYVNY